jgi:hypothetical protein
VVGFELARVVLWFLSVRIVNLPGRTLNSFGHEFPRLVLTKIVTRTGHDTNRLSGCPWFIIGSYRHKPILTYGTGCSRVQSWSMKNIHLLIEITPEWYLKIFRNVICKFASLSLCQYVISILKTSKNWMFHFWVFLRKFYVRIKSIFFWEFWFLFNLDNQSGILENWCSFILRFTLYCQATEHTHTLPLFNLECGA